MKDCADFEVLVSIFYVVCTIAILLSVIILMLLKTVINTNSLMAEVILFYPVKKDEWKLSGGNNLIVLLF